MKRTKRKYTRHEKVIKPTQDAPQSTTSPVKDESSIVAPDREGEPVLDGFTFNDLPQSIRIRVERDIAYRKRLNLLDDSKERKERAIRYFRGDRLR